MKYMKYMNVQHTLISWYILLARKDVLWCTLVFIVQIIKPYFKHIVLIYLWVIRNMEPLGYMNNFEFSFYQTFKIGDILFQFLCVMMIGVGGKSSWLNLVLKHFITSLNMTSEKSFQDIQQEKGFSTPLPMRPA